VSIANTGTTGRQRNGTHVSDQGRVLRSTTDRRRRVTNAKQRPDVDQFASSGQRYKTSLSGDDRPPGQIVVRSGVPNRGTTFAKAGGSNRSRLIAKNTRL